METKKKIDLDTPLMHFGAGDACFTIRDAVAGLNIIGGTGSGKTTGSAVNFLYKYLEAGFGGLVLTVKPTDRKDWIKYCVDTGRTKDLVILEPGGEHRFNWLEYISKTTDADRPITDNIVEVLNTVIRAEEDRQANGDDAFWESALTTLIGMVTDLCLIAHGKISVDLLYNVVQTLPRPNDDPAAPVDPKRERTAFQVAYELANRNVNAKIQAWWKGLTEQEKARLTDRLTYEEALYEVVPEARLSNYLVEYFWNSFRFLSPKTRSIVEFIFGGFLYSLLRDPMYGLLSKGNSTIKPEDCFDGKIILLNLPIKVYQKAGRHCQRLFKLIWQQAVEKRNIDDTSLPVFLWADEAQNTVHEHDSEFLATARSSRVATVFISQTLPSYYAALGGEKAKYKVSSILANLSTKVFHNNTCVETNRWASDLFGEDDKPDPSVSISITKDSFTQGQNFTVKLQKIYRPEKFTTLKEGGPKLNFRVEAIMYKHGDPFDGDRRHGIVNFRQIL